MHPLQIPICILSYTHEREEIYFTNDHKIKHSRLDKRNVRHDIEEIDEIMVKVWSALFLETNYMCPFQIVK